MGEEIKSKTKKSFPVKMLALQVDWLLQDYNGKEFLNQVLMNEDLEIFNVPAIVMIIDFLYGNFR